MCSRICELWVGCGCTNENKCQLQCDSYFKELGQACTPQLDEFLFCAFRHESHCQDGGIYASPDCTAAADAVAACGMTSFKPFVPVLGCGGS
jgi:hypothetical protein